MVVAALAFVVMTAVLAGVGLLLVDSPLGSGVRGWDDSFSREVTTGRTIDGEELSSFVSSSADGAPIVGAALVVTAALLVLRRWRDLFFLPLALLLENLVFLSVSQLVARDRPDVVRLGTTPPTHSFPSGHVAATVVVCFGIVVLLGADRWPRPWRFLAWVAAAVPVLAVGTSRVYGGLHFTTDVVVGVVLGSSALAVAAVASRASWLVSRTEAAVSS
jgi:undecaprenyl-diphosphatase